MATDKTVKERKPHWFKPGEPSANPFGRPKGSRNKLGEEFISKLYDDFQEHGVSVIQAVRAERPDQYLRVIASIVPKEFHIKDTTLDDMSDDDLIEFLATVRSLKARLRGNKGQEGTGEAAREVEPRGQLQ